MKEPGSICPNCGRPLRVSGGRAKCRCGCELEFGVRVVTERVNQAGCPIRESEFYSLAKKRKGKRK